MSAYDLTLGTGQSAIRFDGGAGIVGARHGWGLQNLTDWMSLSDAKNDVNERALQHGAFDPGQTTRQSALITATVAYVGSTVAELEQAIYALNGSVLRISGNIFLFSPEGVGVTVPHEID